MGSTTTVLLSFSRMISLALLFTMAILFIFGVKPNSTITSLIFFSFFIIPYNYFNYFDLPLNPYLEVLLPIILGYFIYNHSDRETRFIKLGIIYLIAAGWLLSSSGEL